MRLACHEVEFEPKVAEEGYLEEEDCKAEESFEEWAALKLVYKMK